MAVSEVSRGVSVSDENFRTLAMWTGILPELDYQVEELVMIKGEKVGKLESHAGIFTGISKPDSA